nr:hypothetical protein Itr_chr03CG24360 [Ipomoea trifida]
MEVPVQKLVELFASQLRRNEGFLETSDTVPPLLKRRSPPVSLLFSLEHGFPSVSRYDVSPKERIEEFLAAAALCPVKASLHESEPVSGNFGISRERFSRPSA